jgi:hypothetical protein
MPVDMSRNKRFFQVRISRVLRFISKCDLFIDSPSYVCMYGWMNERLASAWTAARSYSHSVIKSLSALFSKIGALETSPIKENADFLKNISDEILFRLFMETNCLNKAVQTASSATLSRGPNTECQLCQSRLYRRADFTTVRYTVR